MAQVGNKNIDNASGQVVRLDMQNTVQAVATNNFGQRSSGGTILPCEFFADDTSNKLLIRASTGGDQADPASSSAATFFEVGDLDTANLGLLPLTGGTMDGPILGDASSGSSTPPFSFDGDPDTGMFRQGANSIGFTTGGLEKFRMDANGLSIFSDGSATKNIYFHDVNNSNYVALRAPGTVNANVTLTLPSTVVNGGFLQVDSSGNLSFQTISTSAGGLSGNTLSSNIVNSSLTSVGNLTQLIVSGNAQIDGNLHAGGDINGDNATNITGMAAIQCTSLAASSIIHVTGGLYGQGLTNREPLFYTGVGGAAGKLVRAFVKFSGFNLSGTSLSGVTAYYNVGSVTDHGVGDYQVNYVSGSMRDSLGNPTNEHSVSVQTNNQVYPVQGQFAHTHPMLITSDANHVRFICAADEGSTRRADQTIVMVNVVL